METSTIKPRMPVRRFDVFAEYNRLKGLDKGLDDAHAKGYGLWVAKVVASGGRRASAQPAAPGKAADGAHAKAPTAQEWHVLGGEPQTGALFDREVEQRMGPDFYARVFAPAIAEAVHEGRSYEAIRDAIRKSWAPER
jgi:hypothetical protein